MNFTGSFKKSWVYLYIMCVTALHCFSIKKKTIGLYIERTLILLCFEGTHIITMFWWDSYIILIDITLVLYFEGILISLCFEWTHTIIMFWRNSYIIMFRLKTSLHVLLYDFGTENITEYVYCMFLSQKTSLNMFIVCFCHRKPP